jgi:hypothetical protein
MSAVGLYYGALVQGLSCVMGVLFGLLAVHQAVEAAWRIRRLSRVRVEDCRLGQGEGGGNRRGGA